MNAAIRFCFIRLLLLDAKYFFIAAGRSVSAPVQPRHRQHFHFVQIRS